LIGVVVLLTELFYIEVLLC